MKNNKKTKTQLITELEELRKQNAELEAEKTVRRKEEETLKVSEKTIAKYSITQVFLFGNMISQTLC